MGTTAAPTPDHHDVPNRPGTIPSAGTRAGGHWAPSDVLSDILATAVRADAAEPVEIRVRPEIHHRLVQDSHAAPGHEVLEDLQGIPLVVDPDLPAFPGYEVHRAPPRPRRTDPEASSHAEHVGARGPRAA